MNASCIASLAVGLGIAASVLALDGCAQQKPAYTPAEVKACAAIEADYVEAVYEACHDKFAFDECPDVPKLKADRLFKQKAEGCR